MIKKSVLLVCAAFFPSGSLEAASLTGRIIRVDGSALGRSNSTIQGNEVMIKLLPGLGALLAGILVPLVIHLNGERSRSNQLYAEIVSKREVSDSELRELYDPHKSKRCGRVHG